MDVVHSLNAWSVLWSDYMGRCLIDASLVLAGVMLFWLLIRKKASAQFGYCLFLLVLLKFLFPFEVALPFWQPVISPNDSIQSLAQLLPPIKSSTGEGGYEGAIPSVETSPALEKKDSIGSSTYAGSPSHHSPSIFSSLSTASLGMMVWALVVAFMLGWFGWMQWRTMKFMWKSAELKPSVLPVDFEGLKQTLGIRRPVRLLTNPTASLPLAWGIFRPYLIVPYDLTVHFTPNQIRWILLHELAHIRRNDIGAALFQRIIQIVFFFHPAVWIANRFIGQLREYACDDMALSACRGSRKECGEGLYTIVELMSAQPAGSHASLGLVSRKMIIRRRMMRILDAKRNVRVSLSKSGIAALGLCALLALPSFQPTDRVSAMPSQDDAAVADVKPDEETTQQQDGSATMRLAMNDSEKSTFFTQCKLDFDFLETIMPDCITFGDRSFVFYDVDQSIIMQCDYSRSSLREIAKYEEHISSLHLSPDGEKIVCVFNFQTLCVIDLNNLKRKVIYESKEDEVFPFAWSPDKNMVLVGLRQNFRNWRIGLLATADGSLQIIKSFGENNAKTPKRLCFSQDGKNIVYDYPQASDASKRDIFMISTDGKEEVILVDHPANDIVLGWIPNTNYVLFRSDRRENSCAMAIEVTPGKKPGDLKVIKTNMGTVEPVNFLGDGSFVYSNALETQDSYISTLDSKSGKLVGQPVHGNPLNEYSNFTHDWSPDGNCIAFFERNKQLEMFNKSTLIIQSLQTGEIKKMVLDVFAMLDPRWSPDMKFILATGLDSDAKRDVYMIDVEKEQASLLIKLDNFPHTAVNWWPDGKSCYYQVWDGNRYCFERYYFDTEKIEGLEFPDHANPVILSLNGKYFAYKYKGLNIRSVESGESRQLTAPSNGYFIPYGNDAMAWSPENEYIYYALWRHRDEGSDYELWRVSVSSGEAEFTGLKANGGISEIRVHPDGQKIAFNSGDWKYEYWIMENFLPE